MKAYELDKEKLYQEYINNKLSIRKISKKYSISTGTVRHRLNKFKIKIRDKSEYFKDLINQKFGELLVIKLDTGYRSSSNIKRKRWICQCSCGGTVSAVSDTLISGKIRRCKQCSKVGKNNGRWKGYNNVGIDHFHKIKRSATEREHEFTISIQYISDLFDKQNAKCFYSDIELQPPISRDATASLDRIDSSKGYIEGNVQWVHKDINMMKNTLSHDQFIKYCELITKNLNREILSL